MQAKRLKLPIGIQNLAEIITDGHYYVDKTGFALQLVQQNKYFFLSRPRRFGKSLLVDTLKEMFEGNEALFRGLQVHGKWDWAVRHPVLQISFNDGGLHGKADLERRIRSILQENANRLGLDCPDLADPIVGFRALVQAARARHGQRVVILVDEYDKLPDHRQRGAGQRAAILPTAVPHRGSHSHPRPKPQSRKNIHMHAKIQKICKHMFMTKDSNVKTMLPGAVERNLRQLGSHIHIARKRRKESLAAYAARMQVSIPTLRRLEAGDPSVSMAAYATALWVIGRVQFLGEIANPEADEMALLHELRTIKKAKVGA